MLNENEKNILALITRDPFISQKDIADQIKLSRSAVANIISGLTEKKLLLGRAYVINQVEQIVCIGGANVDRKLYSLDAIQAGTSNPAVSSLSVGGVARNIAENLGRLGKKTSLITVCGNDLDYQTICRQSEPFIDLSGITISDDVATGSYTAILGSDGDLFVALADMGAYDALTPDKLKGQEKLLHEAFFIVADLNCPKETLTYLLKFANHFSKPIAFIPVSSPKMKHLPDDLTGLTWLITNCDESETHLKMEISSQQDWEKSVQEWLKRGVENIVVTHGKEGVLASDGKNIYRQPTVQPEKIDDVTGAGDAFCAALLEAWLSGEALATALKYATANAVKTIASSETVRSELSKEQLKKDLEELKL